MMSTETAAWKGLSAENCKNVEDAIAGITTGFIILRVGYFLCKKC